VLGNLHHSSSSSPILKKSPSLTLARSLAATFSVGRLAFPPPPCKIFHDPLLARARVLAAALRFAATAFRLLLRPAAAANALAVSAPAKSGAAYLCNSGLMASDSTASRIAFAASSAQPPR